MSEAIVDQGVLQASRGSLFCTIKRGQLDGVYDELFLINWLRRLSDVYTISLSEDLAISKDSNQQDQTAWEEEACGRG